MLVLYRIREVTKCYEADQMTQEKTEEKNQ